MLKVQIFVRFSTTRTRELKPGTIIVLKRKLKELVLQAKLLIDCIRTNPDQKH